MQPVTRRLIVISAIAMFGAAAGVSLGSFVTGPETNASSGMNEMFGLDGGFVTGGDNVVDSDGFADRAGPSSYNCVGCDARLHDDIMPGNDMATANIEPYPPYRSEDAPISPRAPITPAQRRDALSAGVSLPGSTAPAPVPALTPIERPKQEQRPSGPTD